MSDTSLKILMGLGFLGLTGLASYGVCSFSSTPVKTIGRVLRLDPTVILLSLDKDLKNDDEKWYEKVQILESGNADPKLEGYSKEISGEEEAKKAKNIKKIKEICRRLLLSDSREYFKFIQARYWCTISVETNKDS